MQFDCSLCSFLQYKNRVGYIRNRQTANFAYFAEVNLCPYIYIYI